MGGRLSSLTRCILNAVATSNSNCVNFVPKSEEKQKQSPSAAIFSQPKSNKDKKKQVFTPLCAIFIRLIEMKTKAERFYLTIFLFVVLLFDVCIFFVHLTTTLE